ncbi:hypothetical protein GQ55_1G228700 [Panicum hallii var. hallii]|uniref:DUF6598 domain-containing protein n=1 Tax=Panicum hallii var. hallii TaxID=1504633 RepID=A0A2T7F6N5_9POAL|nr:hypothetical protein GQ55_1G228700 [Panicum hallii var. hallii]
MDRISDRVPKHKGEFTQFCFDFGKLDLDNECSPAPMRCTDRDDLVPFIPMVDKYDNDDEDCADLEPFFFDEAEAVADHERRMRREQEEARRKEQREHDLKVHNAAMDRILEYEPKLGCTTFTRISFCNLSKFNLDEESPLGPMRYTNADALAVKIASSDDGTGKQFIPGTSANVITVKIASSDVGFPIDVYGTVIARDSLDLKCVYLFKCDRDHCQHITSKDNLLILTGPKRGIALIDGIYFEVNLKIKGGPGRQKNKQLSKGLLTLDGRPAVLEDRVVGRGSFDTRLSKVVITYAVVKRAIEATIAIEVLQGRFSGLITACTTSIKNSIVLHDSKVTKVMASDSKGAIELLQRVVSVSLKEKLVVTIAARTGLKSTIKFTPRVNGGDENEVTCGSIKMRVKVTWLIISYEYL